MKYKYNRKYQKEKLGAVKKLDRTLLVKLFSYLWPYKKWLFFALLFLLISKGIEIYVPYYIGLMTQKILTSYQQEDGVQNAALEGVVNSSLWMLGLLLLAYLLEVLNVLLKSWVGQQAIFQLRMQVYMHILGLPQRNFDVTPVGRLMTRTIHDVDQIDQMFTESIIPLIGNFFLFIGMAIVIWFLDWRMGILATLIAPVTAVLIINFRKNQRRCYSFIRGVVSAMNTFVQEHLTGVSIIRSFGLEKQESKRFEEINEDHCNSYLESVEHFGVFVSGLDFLASLSMIFIFMLLAYTMPPQGFNIGTFFTLALYSMMFFRPMVDLAERYNVLQSALAASERIFDVLDKPKEPTGPIPGLPLEEIQSITFDNVWFAYVKEQWVLKGLSFQVTKGEALAIVGITGAGKSSIMNLLLGLYDFQKGSILINGKDIHEYSLKTLRKHFSVIFQDAVIFSGTIENNINLYDPTVTHDRVVEAIEFVNLKPLVNKFEKGLKQPLLEQGKSLSMGERQLICLARAVAFNRDVIIFDEATANIDSETEKIIQDALKKVLRSKTSLVIAHRLSTIKDATRILVLHEGIARESGTHEQLLSAKGLYEKLYRLQFLDPV